MTADLLAELNRVFRATGDKRPQVWPERWAERAAAIHEAEWAAALHEAEWLDQILRTDAAMRWDAPLAKAKPCSVSTDRYTSKEGDR